MEWTRKNLTDVRTVIDDLGVPVEQTDQKIRRSRGQIDFDKEQKVMEITKCLDPRARLAWENRELTTYGLFNELLIVAVARGRVAFHLSWERAVVVRVDNRALDMSGLMSQSSSRNCKREMHTRGWMDYASPKDKTLVQLSAAWLEVYRDRILDRIRMMQFVKDEEPKQVLAECSQNIATRHSKELDPKTSLPTQSLVNLEKCKISKTQRTTTTKTLPKDRWVRILVYWCEKMFGGKVSIKQAFRIASVAQGAKWSRRRFELFVKTKLSELTKRSHTYPAHSAAEIIGRDIQNEVETTHAHIANTIEGEWPQNWALALHDVGYRKVVTQAQWNALSKIAITNDATALDVLDQVEWVGRKYNRARPETLMRYIEERLVKDHELQRQPTAHYRDDIPSVESSNSEISKASNTESKLLENLRAAAANLPQFTQVYQFVIARIESGCSDWIELGDEMIRRAWKSVSAGEQEQLELTMPKPLRSMSASGKAVHNLGMRGKTLSAEHGFVGLEKML